MQDTATPHNFVRRAVTEPMLHFVLIGIAVFVAYEKVAPPSPPPPQVIQVTPAMVEGLANQFQAAWRHPPNQEELAGLVQAHVREEVLYREALALGLDRNDSVIRQRLEMKMEFLAQDASARIEPTDADLELWYRNNIDQFASPASLTFRQAQLGDPSDASAAMRALAAGAEPSLVGQPSLLPEVMEDAAVSAVDAVFGKGFSGSLTALPMGTWQGPVTSSFGTHLVFVSSRTEEAAPPFETVKDAVLAAWRSAESKRIEDEQYQALLARYEVILPDGMTGP